jgi:hypothetical protein
MTVYKGKDKPGFFILCIACGRHEEVRIYYDTVDHVIKAECQKCWQEVTI